MSDPPYSLGCMVQADVLQFLIPETPPLRTFLRERAAAGLDSVLAGVTTDHAVYQQRLEAELAFIESNRLVTLMLTGAALVRAATEHSGGLLQGQRRVTGSLVAYTLGITDTDPVLHHLDFKDVFVPGLPFPEMNLHVSASAFTEVAAINADQCYAVAVAEPGKDTEGWPLDPGMVVLYRSRRLELLLRAVNLARRRRPSLTVRTIPPDDPAALEFLVWCGDHRLVSTATARVLAKLPGRTLDDLVTAYALSQPASREYVLPAYLANGGRGVPVFRHQVTDSTIVGHLDANALRKMLPERLWLVAAAVTTARLAWLASHHPAEWDAVKRRTGVEATP